MAIKLPITVDMEDGSTYDIIADQRDVMRYEIQPFAGSFQQQPHTFVRFVAFAAMDRLNLLKGKNGKSTMGWEAFNKACVEAYDTKTSEEDEESGKD